MKNILIVQDISSFGKCSTTVVLPIISACGSTGSILPTAILSTHTGPTFSDYVTLDLFDHMKATVAHWMKMGIRFDAIYTGYLGKEEHIDLLIETIPYILKEDGLLFVDPVFADEGEYYPGFDERYAKAQHPLIEIADYILPNYSEACFMLGMDVKTLDFSEDERIQIGKELQKLGAKNIILTGVMAGNQMGATIRKSSGEVYTSLSNYIQRHSHGTGDVFASVFVGEFMRSGDAKGSLDSAVNFVSEAIVETMNDEHPIDYGVHFEKSLHKLIK